MSISESLGKTGILHLLPIRCHGNFLASVGDERHPEIGEIGWAQTHCSEKVDCGMGTLPISGVEVGEERTR